MTRHFYLITLSLFSLFRCSAQLSPVYNINTNNGLSSNHVYCTHIDKIGYLWLGTTDGLYRYNGYALKKYDYSDGLPNTDVWAVKEDKSGNIWPLSITQEMGYIKNNIYYPVTKKTDVAFKDIYPASFLELNNGQPIIINSGSAYRNQTEVGIIKNDTLYSKAINMPKNNSSVCYQFFDHYVVFVRDSSIAVYTLSNWLATRDGHMPKQQKEILFNYNILDTIAAESRAEFFHDRYYSHYKYGGNSIRFIDIHNGTIKRLCLPLTAVDSDKIVFVYSKKNQLRVITDKNMLIIDSSLSITQSMPLNEVYDNSVGGFSTTFFDKDTIWGTIASTNNKGAYIRFKNESSFTRVKTDLLKYRFINSETDSTGYWWSNDDRRLIVVKKDSIISGWEIPTAHNVKKILNPSANKLLVINNQKTGWLRNGKLAPLSSEIATLTLHNGDTAKNLEGYFDYSIDGALGDSDTYYIISKSRIGLYSIRLKDSIKNVRFNPHDVNRYSHIIYNRHFNIIISYSFDRILIMNMATGKRIYLDQAQLNGLGIRGIEYIFTDNYGNLIIQQYDKLCIYNIYSQRLKRVFGNLELTHSIVELKKDKLSIAGRFGVVQCKLLPSGRLSDVRTYANTKNIYYNEVSDVQFSEGYILMKTDMGMLSLAPGLFNQPGLSETKFSIIVNTGTSLHKLKENDTIRLSQTSKTLDIDVINPTGTGNLKLEYNINKGSFIGNGNLVTLSGLKYDKYHTLSITASDNSWRSKPMHLVVYIKPYWWQTTTATRIIWIVALLLLASIIYLSIIITRRVVTRNNERKNMRQDLELKSIYSQINPHFIFNTLSTALYFVKKNRNKEAYEHINQFSDLLRSYIKSSRNKYISIAEELTNLENYLELQLTRFEEKFEYSIAVDNNIDSNTVKIPALLIQPIVENALNHGIFHSDRKGIIKISFALNQDAANELICTVEDNGIGRKKAREIRSETIKRADSYGTVLIKELIDTFNKYEKIKISIEYIDRDETDPGTIVRITIKNIQHAQ